MYSNLRQASLEGLQAQGAPGYAIGGLSVGEPKEEMARVVEEITPHMPEASPRYLMGVGTPDDIINAVIQGVDMFDCVMPTRNARNAICSHPPDCSDCEMPDIGMTRGRLMRAVIAIPVRIFPGLPSSSGQMQGNTRLQPQYHS